jgi:tetratricopeptide (TPR) repeat protein
LWRALDLNRKVSYRFGEGIALVNLGSTLLDLDRAEEAIDYLRQGRRTFAEIDYVDGVGYALHILGRCYLALGRGARIWIANGGL